MVHMLSAYRRPTLVYTAPSATIIQSILAPVTPVSLALLVLPVCRNCPTDISTSISLLSSFRGVLASTIGTRRTVGLYTVREHSLLRYFFEHIHNTDLGLTIALNTIV